MDTNKQRTNKQTNEATNKQTTSRSRPRLELCEATGEVALRLLHRLGRCHRRNGGARRRQVDVKLDVVLLRNLLACWGNSWGVSEAACCDGAAGGNAGRAGGTARDTAVAVALIPLKGRRVHSRGEALACCSSAFTSSAGVVSDVELLIACARKARAASQALRDGSRVGRSHCLQEPAEPLPSLRSEAAVGPSTRRQRPA